MKNTWNYRIIDFGTHKALHEVHYTDGQPRSYTENPATFVSDPDQDEIAEALEMALSDAKSHPVLSIAGFAHPHLVAGSRSCSRLPMMRAVL